MAIPNYRLKSTDKTVITFSERPAGQPEALRAWFYPGRQWGEALTVILLAEPSGTSMRLRLPLIAGAGAPLGNDADASPHPTEERTPERYRVLVVDDNRDAAQLMGMMIEALGHEVRLAADGELALAAGADFLPDLVLMDLGMPRMNGYEAARQMRQQSWGRKALLVALTGWGQEQDRVRTAEAGLDQHLVKPAKPENLRRLLGELPQKRTRRE